MLAVMANHAFTSLERLLELQSDRVPCEAWPAGADFIDASPTTAIAPNWPSSGHIAFEGVQLRYRPGLPLVVHGLSMELSAGERLGIVGRTGAGKSSISVLLFRLVEPAGGRITIDGVDITTLPLHRLRSSLGMIPQSPVLLQGTVRQNLDPFGDRRGEAGEATMRDVLARAQLGELDLDARVGAGGVGLSLGEGQLISFARCLLLSTCVICLDEPTASVDKDTDAKLQALIRTAFSGRTLLCIAHRLQTVIDFDRLLVMEAGRVAALGTPSALLEDRSSAFSQIIDSGGGHGALRAELQAALTVESPQMVQV